MGLITRILNALFGGDRNVIVETAEVFRENSDRAAARAGDVQRQALAQFAAEFQPRQRGLFDRLMDGLNRLPRPAMALGCIGLFVSAMVDPIWFAMRMQGIGLVPEPLWWLLGVIVSFYFGARHQAKGQAFQRSIAATMARTPEVIGNISTLTGWRDVNGNDASPEAKSSPPLPEVTEVTEDNAALQDWRRQMRR